MEKNFIHNPVLLDEIVKIFSENLVKRELEKNEDIQNEQIFVDCTLGLGGHSKNIFEYFDVSLVGIDRDTSALGIAKKRLKDTFQELEKKNLVTGSYEDNISLVHETFDNLPKILDSLGIRTVDAILFDLGVSSMQIDDSKRGFSYLSENFLDMRMNTEDELRAVDVINSFSEDKLSKIIKEYGEERYSKFIARKIVEKRKVARIETNKDLISLIEETNRYKNNKELNSAIKRVFQAIRIYVNNEFEMLAKGLIEAVKRLSVGGIVIVESYHSLEDKIVKKIFDLGASSSMNDLPFNLLHDEPFLENITRKPVRAGDFEVEKNPRSHSVMLRAMRKNREVNTYIEEKYELVKKEYKW